MMLVGMKEDVRNDPQVIDIMKQQGYMGPVPYDKVCIC